MDTYIYPHKGILTATTLDDLPRGMVVEIRKSERATRGRKYMVGDRTRASALSPTAAQMCGQHQPGFGAKFFNDQGRPDIAEQWRKAYANQTDGSLWPNES